MKVEITKGEDAAVHISRNKDEDKKFNKLLLSFGIKHPEDYESITLYWEHSCVEPRK